MARALWFFERDGDARMFASSIERSRFEEFMAWALPTANAESEDGVSMLLAQRISPRAPRPTLDPPGAWQDDNRLPSRRETYETDNSAGTDAPAVRLPREEVEPVETPESVGTIGPSTVTPITPTETNSIAPTETATPVVPTETVKPITPLETATPVAPTTTAKPVEPEESKLILHGDQSKCPKGSDSAANRAKYRATKGKCLIGGTLSEYSGTTHTCAVKSGDKNGKGSCSTKNTYDKYGKLNASVPAAARTQCQPALYCSSKKEPICVAATRGAFTNCERAFRKNAKAINFGSKCLANASEARSIYNRLRDDVYEVCSKQQDDGALCKDCARLAANLKKAGDDSGVGWVGDGSPASAGNRSGGASAR